MLSDLPTHNHNGETTMSDIYDQHAAAFRNVSAWVILDDTGKPVARVATKHGNAVTAYVHLFGLSMVKGRAGGGGYDRMTAAIQDAARKLVPCGDADHVARWKRFLAAIRDSDGSHWDNRLTRAGFHVHRAV
jgi:hypothetical protein